MVGQLQGIEDLCWTAEGARGFWDRDTGDRLYKPLPNTVDLTRVKREVRSLRLNSPLEVVVTFVPAITPLMGSLALAGAILTLVKRWGSVRASLAESNVVVSRANLQAAAYDFLRDELSRIESERDKDNHPERLERIMSAANAVIDIREAEQIEASGS